ncbi:nuclear transport factor 2 family protein [Roseivirga sp.]|uniref:nuclear transport factor 2 family protein n=1 Tax=Roseivirga sp. TaxID=1964215 RepID=UPI003BAAB2A4
MSLNFAQSPEQIVQKQLDTYNARDIDGFMAVMDKEVTLFNFADGQQIASGEKEVRALYTNLFEKSPELNSVLKNRMVLGQQVIDHELITGRMGSRDAIELVVIYEVKKEKIYRITVMRK